MRIKRLFSAAMALTVVCGLLLPVSADAKAKRPGRDENGRVSVIKITVKLSQSGRESKEISDLAKKTNLSRSKIESMMDDGLRGQDIKTVFTATFFVDHSLADVVKRYHELQENKEELLKDYEIDQQEFEKKFNEIFDEDEDEILRNNIPWRKVPQAN